MPEPDDQDCRYVAPVADRIESQLGDYAIAHLDVNSKYQEFTGDSIRVYLQDSDSVLRTFVCTVAGCPGDGIVRVVVISAKKDEELRVFQGNDPRPHKSGSPISVPRNLMQSVWVEFSNGSRQKLASCKKLMRQGNELTYECRGVR